MIASTQTNHPLAVGTSHENLLEVACARLKEAGLRITQPRLSILSALLARQSPACIEHLFAELKGRSCDLVTVYRCLATFEKIGLVRRSYLHNGTSLYAIALEGPGSYHVVCKRTQAVEEIGPDAATELRRAIACVEDSLRMRGYSEVSHLVEFFGVAPSHERNGAGTPLDVKRC